MEDLTGKITGSTLTAVEWNQLPQEVQNVILAAGITLSNGDVSQLNKAISTYSIVGQFMNGGGVADAYTANAFAPRINPPSRVEGSIIRFEATANNTGACTLNAFGTGVDDIKLSDGTTDPDADDIIAGQDVTVIDRSTYFELVRNGSYKQTVLTATNAAWTPQPDTKSIKFTIIGGGGGGGGVDGQGAGTFASSIGGGGGGTAIVNSNIIDATYNITIGAGGNGGAVGANNGTAGADTTVVSSNVNATGGGGTGGTGITGSSSAFDDGVSGGSASGGDINIPGGDSSGSSTATTSGGGRQSASLAGASMLGGNVKNTSSANGANAIAAGAGGGATSVTSVTTNYAGGDGADGIVIIEEFL